MLKYQDFAPKRVDSGSLFRAEHYESLDAALEAANQFLAARGVVPTQVETVVLPNLWRPHEEGTHDASLYASGEHANTWNQFIRVWWWET